MHGMTVLCTGATDGLGRSVARELAARGARVLVHGRDAGRAREVAQEIGSQHAYLADLASLDEVLSAHSHQLAAGADPRLRPALESCVVHRRMRRLFKRCVVAFGLTAAGVAIGGLIGQRAARVISG